MKSYIQGLITGSTLMFLFMIIMGSQKPFSKTYKMKLQEVENRVGILESTVKERFKIVGENFLHLENKTNSPLDLEYNFKSMTLISEPFIWDKK